MAKDLRLSEDEMARIAKREYQRRWRKEHPGKYREYLKKYWAKKYREQQEKAR